MGMTVKNTEGENVWIGMGSWVSLIGGQYGCVIKHKAKQVGAYLEHHVTIALPIRRATMKGVVKTIHKGTGFDGKQGRDYLYMKELVS
tara:strand:- start:78 stop:341 length:264 start_codon:yes stop_codon:yes gene_type:complete